MKRATAYWSCQVIGWSVFLGLGVLTQTFLGKLTAPMIASYGLYALIALLLTHSFRRFVRTRHWIGLSPRRAAPKILLSVALIALVISALGYPVAWCLGFEEEEPGRAWLLPLMNFLNWTFILSLWSGIYFGVHYLEDLQKTRVEKWRLEAAVQEARLQALKSQLNPHFLFNSLNSLRALIVEDPPKAQQAVTQLASILRYSLQSNASTVSLEEEIRVVRNYLALESIRLEERLRYQFEVDEAAWKAQVPPMLIQSLVENAIKHGVATLPLGGTLRVRALAVENRLRIEVRNSGRGLGQNSNSGVGLRNTRERLRLLFGESASLRCEGLDQGEVRVEVDLPMESLDASLIDR